MACSSHLLPYSTQLLISKLGIMIIPLSIYLRALVESCCTKIIQKISYLVTHFHHLGTMMHFTIVSRTSNIYFASCSSMHAHLPLLPEVSTHFPRIQAMLSQPKLSSPLKIVYMLTTSLRHETVLLSQEKNLIAYC